VGLKFSKCLNQTALIFIFKAFGVILLHFKVEKIESRGNFTKKICLWVGRVPEPHLFFFFGGEPNGLSFFDSYTTDKYPIASVTKQYMKTNIT
jgi:hypothetical protein